MDIWELQDKIGDDLLDKTADSFDAVLLEAYYLGKQDGAREALDVSQYVTPEPEVEDTGCGDYECEFCYPQNAPTVYDEGCGDGDCSYCYPQPEDEDISAQLLAALDALAEPEEDGTVYVTIGDGVQIPLDTFVDLLAADLNDLEARLDEMTERIEACEYEAGVKYVG